MGLSPSFSTCQFQKFWSFHDKSSKVFSLSLRKCISHNRPIRNQRLVTCNLGLFFRYLFKLVISRLKEATVNHTEMGACLHVPKYYCCADNICARAFNSRSVNAFNHV